MKKVCILTSVHSVFDVRIFHKEAKTLAKVGYDVTLIAQHNKNEAVDGVRIVPLPKPKNRFERMTKTSWLLFRLALKQKADVYHFHDLELIPAGIVLRLLGNKVIYDIHEDVPNQILYKEWIKNARVRQFIGAIVHVIEQMGVFFFNGIVAATSDIAKKFPRNKTIVLRNFPILELIDNIKPANYKKDKPIIIYAGSLTKIRGIREIIQAMEFVRNKAELWLLGEWENKELEKECKDLAGWKYTKYLGFKSLEEVYSCLKVANIGLHCLYQIERYMNGLPTKVFEYSASRLPIVVSDSDYWRDKFGQFVLFVNPKNPEDIANKILNLLDDEKLSFQLGKKGRQLVKEKYNWEIESEKLLKVYEGLCEE